MAWPFRQLCATSRWMQHLDCWCPPPSQSAGRPCVTERHSRGSECTGVHFQVTHFILSPRTSQLVCCIPTAASPSKLALWVARLAVWRYHSPAATSLDRHHLSSTPRPVPLPGSFWHPHPTEIHHSEFSAHAELARNAPKGPFSQVEYVTKIKM